MPYSFLFSPKQIILHITLLGSLLFFPLSLDAACVPRAESCDGVDNDCDTKIDESDPLIDQACLTGQLGMCSSGKNRCLLGGLVCVRNQAPSTEICDNLDNDCDGTVDDNNPQGNQGCDTGLAGVCAQGYSQCRNGVLSCLQNTTPSVELCDGKDNNCNGVTDEGNPGGDQGCVTDNQGICKEGVTRCTNGSLICARNNNPAPELCDGLDNDCDSRTDESIALSSSSCFIENALGECKFGTNICSRSTIVCIANQATPLTEICDGLDNDCDGNTDENVQNAGPNTVSVGSSCQTACGTGTIICSLGSLKCDGPGLESGVPEFCDALDNDCDGQIDEGQGSLNIPCSTGEAGVCAAGELSCVSGQIQCVGSFKRADRLMVEEECNGIDEDCDGSVDENSARSGLACITDKLGVCAIGESFCENGSLICLEKERISLERCDSKDNDCDGNTDEQLIEQDQSCDTGLLGICAQGLQSCQNGQNLCQQLSQIQEELCDGLDNDCDGISDENNPGGGERCDTTRLGICANGALQCVQGALQCVQLEQEQNNYDPCDALDNDCDGRFDEAEGRIGNRCESSALGICVLGRYACQSGNLICESEQSPVAELCDNLDNDCDGNTDENNPDGGSDCGISGQRGICGIGQTFCQNGALSCQGVNEAQDESCDGLDNDCDGNTDEQVQEDGMLCDTGFLGQCGVGHLLCLQNNLNCIPDFEPQAEGCDGLDNDCDGNVDEDLRLSNASCASALPGRCGMGAFACVNGVIDCLPIEQQVAESCDLIDQDCDGLIDEGLRNRCGYCGDLPVEAHCDTIDEDCDGLVDEGDLCAEGLLCVKGQCARPCESSECTQSTDTCVDGGCINKCVVTDCPFGWRCENGSCLNPCDGINCANGLVCARGECVANSCYEIGCAEGQICIENQCIPNLCLDQQCANNEFCRLDRDGVKCIKSCGSVSCLWNEICIDGLCQLDPCANISCAVGQLCVQGECVRDECVGIVCGTGRLCQQGQCVDDPCHAVFCPAGEECQLIDQIAQCFGAWTTQPTPYADMMLTDQGLDQNLNVDMKLSDMQVAINDQDIRYDDMFNQPQDGFYVPQADAQMTSSAKKKDSGCQQKHSQITDMLYLLFLLLALLRHRQAKKQAMH